jgi:hypothetical protein
MAAPAQKTKVSPDTWIKLGVYVAGGVAIAFGVKKVLDYFKPARKREESEQKVITGELETETKTTPLSYPQSQYATFADIIETAGFDLGTDEDAIYTVFRSLKNNADYLALSNAWGKPTRKVYDFGFGYDMTLPQYLRWEMSDTEVGRINSILKSKNIKYRV